VPVTRSRKPLLIATVVSLAAHALLFTGILWRRIQPMMEDPAILVELVPLNLPPPPPEPKTAPTPKTPAATVQPPPLPPLRAPLIAPPPSVAPLPAAPVQRPAEPRPAASDTDALAKSVLPGKAIDCRWPGMSAAEKARCGQTILPGPGGDPYRPPAGSRPPPLYSMDPGKQAGFDLQVDRRKTEPTPYTATSRCDGWGSDNAQKNMGTGCLATSKREGSGATRPKSKNVQPRGSPFEPMRRD